MAWLRFLPEAAAVLALVLLAFLARRIWRGLQTGVIVDRWPYGPLDRRQSPVGFWANLVLYALVALLCGAYAVFVLTAYLPAAIR